MVDLPLSNPPEFQCLVPGASDQQASSREIAAGYVTEKVLKILCGFASSASLDFISTGVSDNERDANLLLVIVALFLWDR